MRDSDDDKRKGTVLTIAKCDQISLERSPGAVAVPAEASAVEAITPVKPSAGLVSFCSSSPPEAKHASVNVDIDVDSNCDFDNIFENVQVEMAPHLDDLQEVGLSIEPIVQFTNRDLTCTRVLTDVEQLRKLNTPGTLSFVFPERQLATTSAWMDALRAVR